MYNLLIPTLITFALLCPFWTWSQCECTSCPGSIPVGPSTNDFVFEIGGAVIDDLSDPAQGVCGVALNFQHSFIWDLEFTLTSPGGQMITLIGPDVTPPLGSWTGGTVWDILFFPCGEGVFPDAGFAPIWDNDQSWLALASYEGSYYPNTGCLEDFNIGSVNGSWTLSVTNNSSFYTGNIIDFQVLFCDEGGLLCCNADAGDLSGQTNVEACEGELILEMDLEADYGMNTPPDTLEYGYSYIISVNDTIIAYELGPDFTSYDPGVYTVCGLSYLYEDSTAIPAVDENVLLSDLISSLQSLTPSFCGMVTDDCFTVTIQVNQSTITDTLCAGEVYTYNGQLLDSTDIYTFIFPSTLGCQDSTVTIDLVFIDSVLVQTQDTICAGDTLHFQGQTYTASGTYYVVYPLPFYPFCDSTIVVDLEVLDVPYQMIYDTICAGTIYSFDGNDLTETGTYSATYVAENGICDSIVELQLTVIDSIVVFLVDTICAGENVSIANQDFNVTGNYTVSLTTDLFNCDSIIHLDLTVLDTFYTVIDEELCFGDTFWLANLPYTQTGVYELTLQSEENCDSTIQINLLVQPELITLIDTSLCEGDSIMIGTEVFDSTGSYAIQLTSIENCDSIIQLNLLVSDDIQVSWTDTICAGETYNFEGSILDETGVYSATYPSQVSSCDSIITLTLTVLDSIILNINESICQGEVYQIGNESFTLAGEYTVLLPSTLACDTTIYLNLTVSDTFYTVVNEELCHGDTFWMANTAYTQTGLYEVVFPTLSECDSTIQINLLVQPELITLIDTSLCEGDSIMIGTEVFDSTGSYEIQLTSIENCDSIVQLNLLVSDDIQVSWTDTICAGETYNFEGFILDETGVYSATYPSQVSSCDSIITLTLTVLDSIILNINESICQGEVYQIGNESFTLAGEYAVLLPSTVACDTTIYLDLTVSDTFYTVVNEELCHGDTFWMANTAYTQTGLYEVVFPTLSECDSTIQINLLVQPELITLIDTSLCEGDSIMIGTEVFDSTGSYEIQLTSIENCDSIIQLNLLVSDDIQVSWTDTICAGETYNFEGSILDETGVYSATYPSQVSSCDSIITLTLTVLDSIILNINESICQGEEYQIGNESFTLAGEYTVLLPSTVACDTTIYLDLTVSDTFYTVVNEELCHGDTFWMANTAYTQTGIYQIDFSSENNCDSTLVIDLVIEPPIITEMVLSLCEGDSIVIGNEVFDSTGVFEITLTSSSNCDSLVQLNLSVGDEISIFLLDTICIGDVYDFEGMMLDLDGIYSVTYPSQVSSCDSTIYLQLSVLDSIVVNINDTICNGSSYYVGTEEFTTAGNYFVSLASQNYCDSVVQLDLVVLDSLITTLTDTICEGETIQVGDILIGTSGAYTIYLVSSENCDSIVELNLTVVDTSFEIINPVICEGDTFWIDGQALNTTGSFTFGLLNALGCDSTVQVELQVLNPLFQFQSIDTIGCAGSPVGIAVTEIPSVIGATTTFEWVDWSNGGAGIVGGQGTSELFVDQPGIYELIYTESFQGESCMFNDSIEVFLSLESPLVEAGGSDTINCTDTNILLNGVGSEIGPDIIYLWTDDLGNELGQEITQWVEEEGVYFLTVIDTINGCMATDQVEVFLDIVTPESIIQIEGSQTLDCNNVNTELTGVNSLPSGMLDYQWLFNDSIISSNDQILVEQGGNYTLIVTNIQNGCSDSLELIIDADFNVPEAVVELPDTLTCIDSFVVLNGMNSTVGSTINYQWNAISGNILGNDTSLLATVDVEGWYTLVVTDTYNGCTDSVAIEVLENQETPIAMAGLNQSLDCNGEAIQLDGNGSSQGPTFSYQWSGPSIISGINGLEPEVDEVGTYELIVTNLENGCSSTDEVLVLEPDNIISEVFLTVEFPSCHNLNDGSIFVDSIQGGTPSYLYSWNGDPFTNWHVSSHLEAGTYELVIQDLNGCEWDTLITFIAPTSPLLDLGEDVILPLGDSTFLEAITNLGSNEIASFHWYPPLYLVCDTCWTQFVTPMESVEYLATVIDSNGCANQDTIFIQVIKERPIFIPSAFSPNGDGINDILQVYAGAGAIKVRKFKIFDRWGEIVFQAKDFKVNDPDIYWDGYLNGKPLDPAVFIYYVEIEFVDGHLEYLTGDITLMK